MLPISNIISKTLINSPVNRTQHNRLKQRASNVPGKTNFQVSLICQLKNYEVFRNIANYSIKKSYNHILLYVRIIKGFYNSSVCNVDIR